MLKKLSLLTVILFTSLFIVTTSHAKTYFYYEILEGLVDAPDCAAAVLDPFCSTGSGGETGGDISVSISVNDYLFSGTDLSASIPFSLSFNGTAADDISISYVLSDANVFSAFNVPDDNDENRIVSISREDLDVVGSVDVSLTAVVDNTNIVTKTFTINIGGNCSNSIDTAEHIISCDGDSNYLISSVEDLQHVSDNQYVATIGPRILSGSFILTDNLNYTGTFVPLGNSSSRFSGTFDGDSHAITNLYINRTSQYSGLVGYMNSSGKIKNLGLRSVNITGGRDTGGFVGYNSGGDIENTYVSGSVTGVNSAWNVGGMIGYNKGGIRHSYSTAVVSGYRAVGGLIGDNSSGSVIVDSYAMFDTAPSGSSYVGGLGGYIGVPVSNFGDACEYGSNKKSCETNSAMLLQTSWDYDIWEFAESTDLRLKNEEPGGTDSFCNIYSPLSNIDQDNDGVYLIGGLSGDSDLALSQLQCLASSSFTSGNEVVLTSDYKLTTNIDFNGSKFWRPIGSPSKRFTGTFDGDAHRISDLYVSSESSYMGMFGYLGSGSIVKNVGLVDVDVSGASNSAGIAGYNNGGTIENVYVTGAVSGNSSAWNIGGVIGYSKGALKSSYSTATVSGYRAIGGLVGDSNSGSSITDSYAIFDIAPSGVSYVGGQTGYTGISVNNYGEMCEYSNGNKTSCSEGAGTMLQGSWDYNIWDFAENSKLKLKNEEEGSVDIACNINDPLGDIEQSGGYYLIGGAAGDSTLAKTQLKCISNVNNMAGNEDILTSKYRLMANVDLSDSNFWRPIGGLSKQFKGEFDGNSHSISNLSVDVDSSPYIGFVGYLGVGGIIKNLALKNIDIKGGYYTAGVAGYNNGGTITDVYTSGFVTGTSSSWNVGGIVGYSKGEVSNSYSTATVSGYRAVGGLVGDSNSGSSINGSYTMWTTSPSGSSYIGPVTGYRSINVNNVSDYCESSNCISSQAIAIQSGANWSSLVWTTPSTNSIPPLINE